ncbi:hypothetical protein SAMN05421749_10775 [Acinetobacter marinus]|uniref:Uncharacterized protein n=1 Tax=Acinetobacter marinus TaxID=281375 RepID=A0A1G6MNA0_9GAMM|nr:hypothetical protein SAMN05421749_10775 [Acinetobacter marinus]
MTQTYLTTKALSERIHYNERTIRNQLKVEQVQSIADSKKCRESTPQ